MLLGIKQPPDGTYKIIVGRADTNYFLSDGEKGFYLTLRNDSLDLVQFNVGGSSDKIALNCNNVHDNKWHHVVGVRDGNDFSIYCDGNLTSTQTMDIGDMSTTGEYLHIGRPYNDGDYFNGSIDEVMIWNRALSPEEINATYNAGLYKLYKNFTGLSDGIYNYTAYVIDSDGNVNSTGQRQVTIDTVIPNVTIVLPTATTYTSSSISFEVSTSENSTCNYTIDSGATNTSLTTNSSGTGFTATQTLANADYTAQYYCWDLANNLNNSENVTFTVNVPATSTTSSTTGTGFPFYTINNQQFQEGYTKSLSKNSKLRFKVQDENHELKINELTNNSIEITVSSEPQTATLIIEDERKFELTNDNYYDLYVKLNSIENNLKVTSKKANITIQSINELIIPKTIKEEEEKQKTAEEISDKEKENIYRLLWLLIPLIILIVIVFFIIKRYK